MKPVERFTEELGALEARMEIPYPDRALLIDELAGDLDAAYQEARARGSSEDEARAHALRQLHLDDQALRELEALHLPAARRALSALPPPAREWLERLLTVLPLTVVLAFLTFEVPLVFFLREGGWATLLVLAIGLFGLLLELERLFLWFVLRDHSADSLRKNTPTPLYLAAASGCLGVLGSAVNVYVVFWRWTEGQVAEQALRVGLRESLASVIVGAALATLLVLVHAALQAGLRALRIPH